ncbi:hypothetical protein TUBRATIS_25340 [Tubulinosema ratisbonensis]|uniref:Uncharacterized protein n=1 Tax=Tubulinosema ratisbonensis TaxID=291195 RepID=A0A437AIQ7_9MICR|nr:hypothetical protein TUBRATIS_25340 [Tubulinosema ratisbonensis]
MIFLFTIIKSLYFIDENTGLYITSLQNILTVTDSIHKAIDLIPITDGCGIHYIFQDKASGLVLDEIDGIAQLTEYLGIERQRFSLLFDVNGKFQLTKGDYFFVRNKDRFVWTGGLCGSTYSNGLLMINSKMSFTLPSLEFPEIALEDYHKKGML